MDCHDVRSLLAYTRRGSDQIDPTERAAVQQHLEACTECAAGLQSEELLDAALGTAMRDVAVPANLKARVLAKLAASRPRPWGKIAAAAAVLLALGICATVWMVRPLPHIDRSDIRAMAFDADQIEEWYKKRGVDMVAWRQLNYSLLWAHDIVEIKGQRVPKLIFYHDARGAIAEVIVLRTDRFDISGLHVHLEGASSKIIVEQNVNPDYVYVVSTRAGENDLDFFLIKGAN